MFSKLLKKIHTSTNRFKHETLFIILGILSLLWFIIRTSQKPKRITYPCQQIALNNSILFLIYLAGALGIKVTHAHARNAIIKICTKSLYLLVLGIGAISIIISLAVNIYSRKTQASDPIGESKGSVVWIHDESATTDISNYQSYWKYSNQDNISAMLSRGIQTISKTNTNSKAMAWIFEEQDCTNKSIAIKVNFVNDMNSYALVNSPELIISLLELLTTSEKGIFNGFSEENIYVYDITKSFDNSARKYFITAIHEKFPKVHIIGGYCYGNVCDYGAEKAEFTDSKFSFPFSKPTGEQYCATQSDQYIASFLEEADYIINVPLLKGHSAENLGATLGFKNHFGTISNPRGAHDCISTFGNDEGLLGVYMAEFADGRTIAGKTVLTIGDGIFSTPYSHDKAPEDWDFFNGNTPNSIFISKDPVAIDSVMYDLIMTEFELNKKSYIIPGQKYLEASAREGLGIHEHPSFTEDCSDKTNPNCWKYNQLSLIFCDPECPQYSSVNINIDNDDTSEKNSVTIEPIGTYCNDPCSFQTIVGTKIIIKPSLSNSENTFSCEQIQCENNACSFTLAEDITINCKFEPILDTPENVPNNDSSEKSSENNNEYSTLIFSIYVTISLGLITAVVLIFIIKNKRISKK